MSILMGALGGLGEGAAQWAQAGIKHDTDMQMENLRSENMYNKSLALEKAREQIKTAPLQRLGIIAQSQMANQVPVEAEPVTSLQSNTDTQDASKPRGAFHGDPVKVRKDIMASQASSEEKDNLLAALDSQIAAENDKAKTDIAGKTRAPTSDEAFDAAMDKAKIDDPVSYMAGQGIVNSEAKVQSLQDKASNAQAHITQMRDAAIAKDNYLTSALRSKDIHDKDRIEMMQQKIDNLNILQESKAKLAEAQATLAQFKSNPDNVGAIHEKMSTDLGKINQSMDGMVFSGSVKIDSKTGVVSGRDADAYGNLAKSRAVIANKFKDRYSEEGTPTGKPDLLPMPASKDKLITGKTYNTPRGAAVWNGSMFESN